jgi:hypothetical protein
MTSEKQAQANRRNALKSTGPKTPEGKAAVRLNANKHGLRSQEVLLSGEDEEALKELDENLRAELQLLEGWRTCSWMVLSPPTGGFGASGGWRPASSPESFTGSWLSGPSRKPTPTSGAC